MQTEAAWYVRHRVALWVFALVVLRTVAAVFSEGYYKPDEHSQILEFAVLKLGLRPVEFLQWEFTEQMRPGLQPMLVVWLWQALHYLEAYSPFLLTFLTRLATGLLSVWVLWALLHHACKRWLPNMGQQTWLWGLAILLWFLPVFSVRYSSENWSSLGLVWGFLLWLPPLVRTQAEVAARPKAPWWHRPVLRYVLAGFALGMAFNFRMQACMFVAGMLAYSLWQERRPWAQYAYLLLGGLLALALEAYVDYLYYGNWVFPPYNYVVQNLVLGKADHFGRTHFFWYFYSATFRAYTHWGALLWLAVVMLLVRQLRHPLTLPVWFFLIGHFAVGHKELRFLFPLLPFCPLLQVLAFEGLGPRTQFVLRRLWQKRWAKAAVGVALFWNTFLLVGSSLTPLNHEVAWLRQINHWVAQNRVQRLVVLEDAQNRLFWQDEFLHFYLYQTPGAITLRADTLPDSLHRALPPPTAIALSADTDELRRKAQVLCPTCTAQQVFAFPSDALHRWGRWFYPLKRQYRAVLLWDPNTYPPLFCVSGFNSYF